MLNYFPNWKRTGSNSKSLINGLSCFNIDSPFSGILVKILFSRAVKSKLHTVGINFVLSSGTYIMYLGKIGWSSSIIGDCRFEISFWISVLYQLLVIVSNIQKVNLEWFFIQSFKEPIPSKQILAWSQFHLIDWNHPGLDAVSIGTENL